MFNNALRLQSVLPITYYIKILEREGGWGSHGYAKLTYLFLVPDLI